eukprot:TRINITY_DN5261_c0_g1_i2.p1 TRINITY_DN5261_c0_g1~~TRINITY_DN5261_c0_g1_i2.p1  ORF type:complete len:625 (-),score=99.01 TRINITY_DN5261_c0_g1_i2:307-2016(-)
MLSRSSRIVRATGNRMECSAVVRQKRFCYRHMEGGHEWYNRSIYHSLAWLERGGFEQSQVASAHSHPLLNNSHSSTSTSCGHDHHHHDHSDHQHHHHHQQIAPAPSSTHPSVWRSHHSKGQETMLPQAQEWNRYLSSTPRTPTSETDYAFQMASSNIRFGWGATKEVGADLKFMKCRKVLVFTDKNLRNLAPVINVLNSLQAANVQFSVFDDVSIEPTDKSLQHAIKHAQEGEYDSFVAVGGGSVIDTAKAANLYATYPADFLDYVNPPIGKGIPVPGPLLPLIAIPTTAGTGSETTGTSVFDLSGMNSKTGISHRELKPTLGIVDPENTASLPSAVAAASGLDQLSHALESWTATPYNTRPLPPSPEYRPAYQGSNPISDHWSMKSLELACKFIRRAVHDRDPESREAMLLASTYAGIGFGNAGVHLPHAMSYPASSMTKQKGHVPEGYGVDHALLPHGQSVILHAPAVFRWTGQSNPERHRIAAEIMGADVSNVKDADSGSALSDQIVQLMKDLQIPDGLSAVGFDADDIPALVKGSMPQHRLTKLAPRQIDEESMGSLYAESLVVY